MIGRQTHESRLAYLFYFTGLDVFEFIVHFKS